MFFKGLGVLMVSLWGLPAHNPFADYEKLQASMARAGEGLFKKYLPKNIHEKVR